MDPALDLSSFMSWSGTDFLEVQATIDEVCTAQGGGGGAFMGEGYDLWGRGCLGGGGVRGEG